MPAPTTVPGALVPPADPPTIEENFRVPLGDSKNGTADFGEIGLAAASLGGFGAFLWAVPSLALSVPGLLLVAAILAQAAGGLAWIPIVRRRIGGFGLRGDRPRTTRRRG
jgi:hypothetical protein